MLAKNMIAAWMKMMLAGACAMSSVPFCGESMHVGFAIKDDSLCSERMHTTFLP